MSFIDWGEKFPGALPYGYLEVRILVTPEGGRRIIAHALGNRARQLLTVWANDSKARLSKTTANAGGFILPGGAPMTTGSIPPIRVEDAGVSAGETASDTMGMWAARQRTHSRVGGRLRV